MLTNTHSLSLSHTHTNSNRALHPTLLQTNTLDTVTQVAERGGEGAICCMLAAAEFVGRWVTSPL